MDYRKHYEKLTKIKVPEGFEIHHIDFNRKNNNIRNLVALPKYLHNEYHRVVTKFKNKDFKLQLKLTGIVDSGNGFNNYYWDCVCEFLKTYKKCQTYIDYRDYLLGIIIDVHKIGENYGCF